VRTRDVVVVLDESGVPHLETHGSATRALHALGYSQAALSISHERAYATAIVLLT
jgi:phosphopantetheinyl transferase (holo-ACP synthase)